MSENSTKMVPDEPTIPDLTEHWNAILRIYDVFSSLAAKHGLRHYVMFGSAIGAIRHKGFIPWDDDMDVAMPRLDYDKFARLARHELPETLKWIDWHNTPEYPALYGKIQETDRNVVLQVESHLHRVLPHGIYLDVFPLDGYPRGFLKILRRRFMRKMLRARIASLSKEPPKGIREWCVRLVGKFSATFFDHFDSMDDKLRIEESIATSVPTFSGKFSCYYSTGSNEIAHRFPSGCFEPHVLAEFEGRMVPLPGDFDTILKVEYGNYMELPPPEKRICKHGASKLAPWKFGPTCPDYSRG